MKANPLLIVAALFGVSFAGRAVGIANAALTKSDAPSAIAATTLANTTALSTIGLPATTALAPTDTQHQTPAAGADPALAVTASQKAAQNAALLQVIRERSQDISERESAVEDRIRVLEILEERVEEKLTDLKQSNADLSKLVSFANEASQKDITLLARMYEQMKPQKAGEIFNKMNPTFAAGFLTEMNSENAALILANMSTDKAYETSMIIANRNASVYQQ